MFITICPLLVSTQSHDLQTPFDSAESRLAGREGHVVRHYRLCQTLQCERAHLFGCDASLQRDIDALTEENLAVLGLGTKTGGDIAHCADRGMAGAPVFCPSA
jgi:hypothetical protein